jgi:hypothetical protein
VVVAGEKPFPQLDMSQKKRLGKPQLYKPAYFNEILLQVIPAIDTRNQQGLQTTLFKHIRQRLYRQAKSVAFPLTFQPKVRFFSRCTPSGLIKDRDGHGLQLEEITMRLITRFELAGKNENELHVILRQAFNELAKSNANTHERRNALASIEKTQREISSRTPSP